jgi:hypothetical protein
MHLKKHERVIITHEGQYYCFEYVTQSTRMLYAVSMYSGGQTATHGVRFNSHILVYTFSVRTPNFIRTYAQVKGKQSLYNS